MTDNQQPKRPRGKPLGYKKPDAMRIEMKLRWNEAELNEVKAAADDVKEAAALFIRSAALMRSRAKAKAKRLRAKAKAMETDYPLNAVRIEGMAEAYEKIASGK